MRPLQLDLPLGFTHRLTCSAADPNDPNHHIRKKPNGYWQLRVTVDRGPKYVGARVVIGLKTKCEQQARERRDLVLSSLEKAKLVAASD